MSKNVKAVIAVLCFLASALGIIAVVPLLVLWSLNTVFSLSIAYTFWTWLGCGVLLWFFTPKTNFEYTVK